MNDRLARGFNAAPDALTALVFLTAWIAPGVLGPQSVKNLMLTMLIEFVVIHSTAFFFVLYARTEVNRGMRILALLGLSLLYMIFIAAFAFAFDSWWPIFAFGWLFASRAMLIWTQRDNKAPFAQMSAIWVLSTVCYVIGAAVTAIVTPPQFGITPQFVASMHLSGSGEWIEKPQTVIVFGLLYFAVQAWLKYALSGNATTQGSVDANDPVQRRFAGLALSLGIDRKIRSDDS